MKYLDSTGLTKVLNLIKKYIDDNCSGSGTGSASGDFYSSLPNSIPVHNAIYRGKDITENLTSGKFTTDLKNNDVSDIFIGDYFDIETSGHEISIFRIAGINCDKGDCPYTVISLIPDFSTVRGNLTDYQAAVKSGSDMFTAISNLFEPYNLFIAVISGTEQALKIPSCGNCGFVAQATGYDELTYPLFNFDRTMIHADQNYFVYSKGTYGGIVQGDSSYFTLPAGTTASQYNAQFRPVIPVIAV